jgi:hypothetical protein
MSRIVYECITGDGFNSIGDFSNYILGLKEMKESEQAKNILLLHLPCRGLTSVAMLMVSCFWMWKDAS